MMPTHRTAWLISDVRGNIEQSLANHNKPTGGWTPAGKSAIWDSTGLIAAADQTQNALVIAAYSPSGLNGTVIEI
jgi:hypothetical protein